jgi:gamma-glutamyl:cysteine ligase YbdK (ATP-grasp superfamily)
MLCVVGAVFHAEKSLTKQTNLRRSAMSTFGVERERFITKDGRVVPGIGTLLPRAHDIACAHKLDTNRFTFELFAGQVEDRTPPCDSLDGLRKALVENDDVLLQAAQDTGFAFNHSECIDPEMVESFQVNPFDARHGQIWNQISGERRIAASVVAAVHVHIAVDPDRVINVLNRCRKPTIDRLIRLGDHSSGRRISAYRTMAEVDGLPPLFNELADVLTYINDRGGERNVWDLVRYKPSTGTVEFRMFGATANIGEIVTYVCACRDVCDA